MKGVFIALEGIEGTGKSTLVPMLAERLKAGGHDPVVVREPGGTPLAEAARQVVLHEPLDITPASELFLYQAARADLVARVIRPALEQGRVVLADRFEMSTRAYQGAGRGLPLQLVENAIALAVGDARPDLYLVLDITVKLSRDRQSAQGKRADRIEGASDAFHERVAEAFRAMHGPGIVHLPADQPLQSVFEASWNAVTSRFPILAGNR